MIILYVLFFSSLLLLLHSYILYPLSIWILTVSIKKKFFKDDDYLPNVSIIISVFNEEKVIENTLRILQECYYPKEKVEILVGSDNSTDKTNNILEGLLQEFGNIKVFNFNQRRGKPHVINDLVKVAKGEILIFCDANTLYNKEAVKKLVKYYVDPTVGGISGKLKLRDFEKSKSGSQEKKYWDAEVWLKEKEGSLGILIGANGGIYSIRKEYFEKIPSGYPVMDDFYISLKVIEKGKAFLYINDAIAEEYAAPTIRAEFNRKIRNNSIMMSTIKTIKLLLNPKFGLISYALWSHKIIRWFTPVLLLMIFFCNIILLNENTLFVVFFIIQFIFYSSAVMGYILKKLNIKLTPLLLSFYFVMTNVAMFIGTLKFLFRKQTPFWQSTPR